MEELSLLRDLVVIFAVAVVVVLLLRRVHIPSIAGFIVVGILVGPRALSLVRDPHDVELLAEIGIVLLLFGIGLELSLDRLRRLWRPIVIGGAFQVGLTLAATAVLLVLFGEPIARSIFAGFMVAISSTAIVLRSLQQRDELDAPHGRFTLGVLVFQDLCVVPMILAIPFLSGATASVGAALISLLKALAVIALVLTAARLVVPHALHLIARTRQRDLFVLVVLLICVGTAWLLSWFGISLALGAFLAGLVVSGSEYRHQALADLIPFREVLSSLFFVSMGMLLDPAILIGQFPLVMVVLCAVLFGKLLIVLMVARVARLTLRAGVLSGAALAQIGEFSFVLRHTAEGTHLVSGAFDDALFVATVLSMLVTPLLLIFGPKIAAGVERSRMLLKLLDVPTTEDIGTQTGTLRNHVIIAGYGVAGRELAQSLRTAAIPYLVVDLNADTVRTAAKQGESICFGDVTSPEVLEQLRLAHAREMVVVINDPTAMERVIKSARAVSATVPVIVRTRYPLDVPELLAVGATEVVPAELEAAVEITGRVLRRHRVNERLLRQELNRIRLRRGEEETPNVDATIPPTSPVT